MTNTLPDDWWTTDDVATYLGVTTSTLRAYLARQQMPAPDRKIGPMSLWRPQTIRDWNTNRPSRIRTAESGSS